MTSTWMQFLPPLLLLSYFSVAQSPVEPTAPGDSICLSEILISTPQPYDPSQVAAARQKADRVRGAVLSGAGFESVAREYSDGPTLTYTPAGAFKRGELAREIEDKVFGMKSGDVSDVIRTKQGFVILRVTVCSRATGGGFGSDGIEILSDTHGVDFGPYLHRVRNEIYRSWKGVLPPTVFPPVLKQGRVEIRFAIMKDGTVKDMKLVASAGDAALDRAAWAGVIGSSPLPPLPSEFTGARLELRLLFSYNEDKGDLH